MKAVTEEEIIKRIRSGGKGMDAGVKALYQSVAKPMLRFFVYLGVSGDEAKDILQDTFIKVVRGAGGFTGKGTAKAWLWQIARNCLTDHIRKKASLGEYEVVFDEEGWRRVVETAADPVPGRTGTSVDECVSDGLKVFSKEMPERAYVLELQMDGMSIEDIGLQIGRTVAATTEFLSQCRKKIKPFIAHCHELLTA